MNPAGQTLFGSQILSDRVPSEATKEYWRSLFYLNIYRIILAVFLVTASLASFSVGNLGSRYPEIFAYTSFIYAFLGMLFMLSINRSWPSYLTQCRLQILTDLVITILLYYSSSGRGAGLEILFFVSVSASGILLGGRGALTTAAAASILLIIEHAYVILTQQRPLGGFTTLGFIGVGLFATAFIIYSLTVLLRRSQAEIAQKSIDLQKLSHINDLIVEQLDSGVIVVDSSLKPLLINQSGRKLLKIDDGSSFPELLEDILPDIALKIYSIDQKHEWETAKIVLDQGNTLLIRYKPLGDTYQSGYIILIDDYSAIENEQRNEKFIAMGRLSASIAHEIRNPLGAISHAGQLLAESSSISESDMRLIEIIDNQGKRINQIIKTILELGQSNAQKKTRIKLYKWLNHITDEFINDHKLVAGAIELDIDTNIIALGDPEQLRHVIFNLFSNGLKHSDSKKLPIISVCAEAHPDKQNVSISITDNGPGIPNENRDRLFEPFWTTSSSGHGLGLYIARKICLSNDGTLDYTVDHGDKHFFVITLSSPPSNIEHTNLEAIH